MGDVIRKDSAVIDIIADIKATYIKAKARVGLIQTATRRRWKGA
jgi:hypothetical protein